MTRLARYLAVRVVVYAAAASALAGLFGWATAVSETKSAWALGPSGAAWLVVGTALLAAPVAAAVAVTWLCARLGRGPMDLLASSGVARARVGAIIGRVALALVVVSALGTELCLPFARDVLAPLLAWEKKSKTPVLWLVDDMRIAARFGARMSHMKDAWAWTDGVPERYRDLEFDGSLWRERATGRELAAPAPATLLGQRPYLFELLTVAELVEIGGGGAYAVAAGRMLRPLFWWLWLAALAHLLLARQRAAVTVATVALVWLAAGLSTLVVTRTVAGMAAMGVALPLAAAAAAWFSRSRWIAELRRH